MARLSDSCGKAVLPARPVRETSDEMAARPCEISARRTVSGSSQAGRGSQIVECRRPQTLQCSSTVPKEAPCLLMHAPLANLS